jgi:xylan 1,4-beta-xylosidase
LFEQALVGRRQEHFAYRAETELNFRPRAFQHAAGLTAYYNRTKFHRMAVGWDEKLGDRSPSPAARAISRRGG